MYLGQRYYALQHKRTNALTGDFYTTRSAAVMWQARLGRKDYAPVAVEVVKAARR